MARVRVGCVGWSYPEWVGPFYPPRAEASSFLALYARAFDIVEIDSSFYSIPSQDTTHTWLDATPDEFLFTAKFPRLISHDRLLENVEDPMRLFFSALAVLKPKLGPLLLQLPPWFSIGTGRRRLEAFVDGLPQGYRYAIEFRHRSWFTPETYSWLEDRGVALCWSENENVEVPPEVTTDFVYLRFVGDRTLPKLTGAIQRDRTAETRKWFGRARAAEERVTDLFVFFNNHFAGFGPGSANLYRELAGLGATDWTIAMKEEGQRSLLDFGQGAQ